MAHGIMQRSHTLAEIYTLNISLGVITVDGSVMFPTVFWLYTQLEVCQKYAQAQNLAINGKSTFFAKDVQACR